MKTLKTTTILATALLSLLLGACATTGGPGDNDGLLPGELEIYLADKPVELRAQFESLFRQGPRNAVLNQVRIGLAAMELGYFDLAEAQFEGALLRIERVYAQDRKADLAKSKFEQENIKDFKGEPYERAMAYLYRGLLYLRRGDYQNARAAFLAGEFQDTVANDETFKGDFGILNYLAGWATQCDGDADFANRYFQRALEHNPQLERPGYNDNVLFIAGIGNGPTKIGTGRHSERLEFRKGTGADETRVRFRVPEAGTVNATEATDLFWQATTRGGRPIEAILEGKAQFKDVTAAGAEVSSYVAQQALLQANLETNTDMLGYGAAAAAVGLAFQLFSDNTVPAADTRYWDNLPATLAVATARVGGELGDVTAEFANGRTNFPKPAFMQADAGTCAVVWSRSSSSAQIPASAPGSELSARQRRKLYKHGVAELRAFRSELLAADYMAKE